MTTISKDGNATEHYEKSVVTEHISTMEPHTEKIPKLYFYKFVIVNLFFSDPTSQVPLLT